MDQVRHDAAHETFHTFQQSLFYTLSSLAQRGYVARHWWMEATADYAADRIALGGSGTMAKPNLEYFKAPLNTADQIHDYATSRFIDYLVEQKGVVFKDLWDASIANSSDDMVAFLETYLMKTTATMLHDHYKGFAEYVLFDASSPLELNKGSGLSGVTMTSGPYKGKLQGGLVEADTPPVLAADKKEISYVFNLTGGYTAKLWGFKALNKDPRSPRTLKIEAVDNVPKAPDVDANVYVLKKDERLKGGAAVNPDIFKGTISANRKKISLTLAADEVAYILAFNTGSGDKKLTVKVGEEGLTISPLTASVNTGNNVNFSTPGVTDEVLWSVPGEGGGTISSQGVYTAPNKAGTYQVEVALKSNPAMTAGALVTVTEPAGSEELKTVKMHIDGFDAEVTGYFLGGKLIKRHGLTKRFDGEGKKFEEDDYQDGKKIRARGYNSDNGRLMSESEFCGDADKEFECHRKDFALDGTIEFEKRRLSKDADWQSKTSTGEWF
jgi:hypothetical protein